MTVLIDDRAGSKQLLSLPPLDSIAESCRLDSADVLIPGNGPDNSTVLVGVEVKSVWDLISSINTGRLQATQIPAMLQSYDVNWLLIYGTYRSDIKNGQLLLLRGDKWKSFALGSRPVPYAYIEHALMDFSALGVHIKQVANVKAAAVWLGALARWWGKKWTEHKGMRRFDTSRTVSLIPGMDEGVNLRARIAAQLPGVGFERALQAAKHFPSVQAMMNATAKEWMEVEGIGKGIAKSVEAVMR